MARSQTPLIGALLVAYGSFYLCRANVDAALPFLAREGFDRTSLGLLSSIATFAYAIGKIVNGAVGDALGGRRLLLLAIGGSVLCSLAFGTAHGFAAFVVLASANRFFQSGGWPGLVHVVSRQFEPPRHGLIMGVLSTSYELGNVCALTLSGLVAQWGWRALFVVNPLLFALVGGGAVLSLRSAAPEGQLAAEKEATHPEPRESLARVLPHLLRSGAFWTAVALSALLTFIRIGFLTWTPTYLSEISLATGGGGIPGAIVKSALFPAAGVIAAPSFGVLSDRLGPGRRAPLMAASLAVVVALVLSLAHGGVHQPLAAAMLIGAIGLFLLGPYSLPAGALALDVAGTKGPATAAGIIDGAGYLGATASGYLLGHIADRAGWSTAFDVIGAAAMLATVVSGAWAFSVVKR
jgi:MFS transporter, OPA family, glycerol-3-phosphate transporter